MLGAARWRPGAAALRVGLALLAYLPTRRAQSYYDACPPPVEQVTPEIPITDGAQVGFTIGKNITQLFKYSNYDLSTMERPAEERRLLIHLEPCYGSVFLFVRKNINCHPDPYSCIRDLNLPKDQQVRNSLECTRTHFMSDISYQKDGASTLLVVSLSAVNYYISVFATEESFYKMRVTSDIGAQPMRGADGSILTQHRALGEVMIQWAEAFYLPPLDRTSTLEYSVYAILLEDTDQVTYQDVFLRPNKTLNTVCGLENNTDNRDDAVTPDMCTNGLCNMTFANLQNGKKYAFNVVAKSVAGYEIAYAGALMLIDESTVAGVLGNRRLEELSLDSLDGARRLSADMGSDEDDRPRKDIHGVQVIAAVMSSVLGVVGMTTMVAAKALFSRAR